MLNNIKSFFDNHFISNTDTASADSEHALRLAMAALMVEVAESDYKDTPEERDSIVGLVKSSFELSDDETAEIVNLAREEHSEAIDYFQIYQFDQSTLFGSTTCGSN